MDRLSRKDSSHEVVVENNNGKRNDIVEEDEEESDDAGNVVELEVGSEEQNENDSDSSQNNTQPQQQEQQHSLPSKVPFRLKRNRNGNILSIHHTVREGKQVIRVRLGVCCFSDNSLTTQFVAIDKRGNVFVFDLTAKRFWRLALIVLKANIIIPHRSYENEYLIGTKTGQLILLDVGRSLVLRACQVSQQPIYGISLPDQSNPKRSMLLVHAGPEAIMVELKTLTATHRLDFDEGRMALKFACYVPQMEQIFTCFTSDAIHIWSSLSLRTVQMAHPIRTRDRKIRSVESSGDCLPTFQLKGESDDETFAVGDECELQNFSDGLIGTFCFTTQGAGLLCLATIDKYLMLLNPRTLDLQQIFRLLDFIIQRCIFLKQPNQILIAALTTKGKAIVLDCQNTEVKLIIHNNASYINVSNDGKLLSVIGCGGETDLWTTCGVYNTLVSQQHCVKLLKEAFKQPKPLTLTKSECFNEELKRVLQRNRMLAILKEYGYYPHKYRSIIWCSLLKLPCNRLAYQQLLKLNTPAVVKQKAKQLKITDETLKRAIIKVWSCLANWCKVFAHTDFFPQLIIPFVKMFLRNAIIAFEICVALLFNHFQLWFEFHPLPPVDYLGMCENVLQYFDPELCTFYANFNLKGIDYAWPIVSHCFYKVLDEEQWLILWDHIISYPLEFTIFCVAAYNILQRDVIMLLPDRLTIEHFFFEKNPINVMKLLKKASNLMTKCPKNRHPERYFELYCAIPRNVYPKFLRYPRERVARQEDEMVSLQREQEAIEARIRALELNERKIMEDLEEGLKREEHAKRLKEMEKLYQDAIKREEERVACQRKLLCLYQKEIRGYKGQVMATLRESERRKRVTEMEIQLEKLMNNLDRERNRNDGVMLLAEDELKNQNFELLAKRYDLEHQTITPDLGYKFRNDLQRLLSERLILRQHMNDLQSAASGAGADGEECSKARDLTDIERKLDDIQTEFLRITNKQ